MFGGLYDFVEMDDVGMPDELQDVDFPGDPLHICHVDDLILF